jgi:putative hydrolase of HD superfamily
MISRQAARGWPQGDRSRLVRGEDALAAALAAHITALVAEHESAKTPDATLESRCSRDADKLELLLQAREYQAQGNQLVQPWIDSMIPAITTRTGMALAKTAQDLSPSIWWDEFAAAFGIRNP